MLRFLFKSQLSDRNALPFYIALKTPVCMHGQKKNRLSRLQLQRNSFASGAVFNLYSCCTYTQVTESGRCGEMRVQGGNIHGNYNLRQICRCKWLQTRLFKKINFPTNKKNGPLLENSLNHSVDGFFFCFVSYWSNWIKSEWQKNT